MNGFEEGLEFLPVNNTKKVEKRGPRPWVVLVAVLIGVLLSVAAGLLVWHFQYRNGRVQKVFNGYLRVTNENFVDAYENPNSTEFAELANKVKEALKLLYSGIPVLGPYHKESAVTAFSEGSIIAYYWSEFSIPSHLVEESERAMAEERAIKLPPRTRTLHSFVLTSVVAFPTDPRTVQTTQDNRCRFALHARGGELTRFTTPGFPDSPYPAFARCQWTLRGDANFVLSLTFRSFDVAACDNHNNDRVMVYDTLSPVEPRTVVQLCGTYSPSYNLTFVSSQNVLLVTLITNTERRHPGFEAVFFQLPKMSSKGARAGKGAAVSGWLARSVTEVGSLSNRAICPSPGSRALPSAVSLPALGLPGSWPAAHWPLRLPPGRAGPQSSSSFSSFLSGCGGYLRGTQGTFSSPYYPGHYPPNINCTWDIEVPSNRNVKVSFKVFYLWEPSVPLGTCSKDYVEVNGEKFCGERTPFMVASKSNRITVHFHSDQSYTDTGFSAEYLSYDSSDRE